MAGLATTDAIIQMVLGIRESCPSLPSGDFKDGRDTCEFQLTKRVNVFGTLLAKEYESCQRSQKKSIFARKQKIN